MTQQERHAAIVKARCDEKKQQMKRAIHYQERGHLTKEECCLAMCNIVNTERDQGGKYGLARYMIELIQSMKK